MCDVTCYCTSIDPYPSTHERTGPILLFIVTDLVLNNSIHLDKRASSWCVTRCWWVNVLLWAGEPVLVMSLALLGKLCILAAIFISTLYSIELFPTVVRYFHSQSILFKLCHHYHYYLYCLLQMFLISFITSFLLFWESPVLWCMCLVDVDCFMFFAIFFLFIDLFNCFLFYMSRKHDGASDGAYPRI